MQNVRSFFVLPALPEPLRPLRELAYNLWWTWTPEAIELMRRLDVELWRELRHNPVAMLAKMKQERLDRLAQDPAYIAALNRVRDALQTYLDSVSWFERE